MTVCKNVHLAFSFRTAANGSWQPVIIIIHMHGSLAGSQNSTGLTAQTLLIHCSAKTFLTIRRVLTL